MFRLIEFFLKLPFKIIALPFKIIIILFSSVYNMFGKLLLVGLTIASCVAIPPIGIPISIIVWLYMKSNSDLE